MYNVLCNICKNAQLNINAIEYTLINNVFNNILKALCGLRMLLFQNLDYEILTLSKRIVKPPISHGVKNQCEKIKPYGRKNSRLSIAKTRIFCPMKALCDKISSIFEG